MVNRIVVVAVCPRGRRETDRAAVASRIRASQRRIAEGVVAGLIDEAKRHALGAGVLDGELRDRADAAPGMAPHAAGPPIDGDKLRAIQIHRRRRGVRAGDGKRGGSSLRADGESVRGGGAESGEDERESLHGAHVGGLEFQHERTGGAVIGLNGADRGGEAGVVTCGTDGTRASQRGGGSASHEIDDKGRNPKRIAVESEGG